MLNINNISSGYGKKQVLFDVSLTVNSGDVILLSGGNGSGKSTLLKCIYKLLPLWSGCIRYREHDIVNDKPSDLIHNGIVYIPQKDFYFENLTVFENLRISGNMLPAKTLNLRISDVADQIGLKAMLNRKPFDLSGGERKLLAFGMGLIHKPKLLLFDEPFSGIDNKNTVKLLQLLKDKFISENNGLIIVDHTNEANHLHNRKIKMKLGKISANSDE